MIAFNTKVFFMICTVIAILSSPYVFSASLVRGKITSQGPTNSLVLSGQKNWIYQLTKAQANSQPVIVLESDRIEAADLAIIQKWTSPLIEKIEVVKDSPEGRSILRVFPKSAEVEVFDYQTDQPSKLILDFYLENKSPVLAQATARAAKTAVSANTNKASSSNKNSRTPASDAIQIAPSGPIDITEASTNTGEAKSGVYDGADPEFSRFSIQDYEIKEDAIISSKQNLYMEFPVLRQDLPSLKTMLLKRPVFEIEPKDSDENKQARLLLTLFQKKRFNVLSQTVDWFLKKFPDSEYSEMIHAMKAEAQFEVWNKSRNPAEFDIAMLNIRQFIEKFPQSVLVPNYQLMMGFANLERGDYLNAIRSFKIFIRDQKNSTHLDLAELAIAEAHLKINQFDAAVDSYKKVMVEGKRLIDRQRAAYFMGDAQFKKKEYRQAIQSYQTALQQYPEAIQDFPSALYNQAAALFHLENYKESLAQYRKFLTRFPDDSYAGYAMTRVGELLEILGADSSRVVGSFLETTFRYGDSPSAVVAKLRLLSSRFPGMKPKEVEKAVEEIFNLSAKSPLPKIEPFANLMVADGYARRKEFDKAIEILVKFYQNNPTTADTKLLSGRIAKNINDKIRQRVESGEFLEALQTYDSFSQSWLKGSDRIDTKYLIGRAYEQAGAWKEAENLYRLSINKIYALQGTKAGRETNIFEKLPSTDELNLRLASVMFSQNRYAQSHDFLTHIKQPESLSENQQVERIQLATSLLQERGDLTSAIRYLTEVLKVHKGIPALTAGPYYQLGQMELVAGKKEEALKSFGRVDALADDSLSVEPTTHSLALEKLASIHLEQGKKDLAMKYYQKLLEKYESKGHLESVRYRLGKIHFEDGEMNKAGEVWSKLPESGKNKIWSRMAQENLKNSKWKDDYKKYTERIPAMAKEEANPPKDRSE